MLFLQMYKINKKNYNNKSLPISINEPRIPQYIGVTFTIAVRIDIAARVKKKFQCCPYSPT